MQPPSPHNPGTVSVLPRDFVRVTELPTGLELYFPPLRNVGTAVGFGVFGGLSIALTAAAIAGAGLADAPGVQSSLAVILVAGFALPVMVIGLAFLALSLYLPSNSLTVRAANDRIETMRRVFGLVVSTRSVACSDIAALQAQRPRQFQSQFSTETRYRIVARSRNPQQAALVVAESLAGRAAMQHVAELLARASGLELQTD